MSQPRVPSPTFRPDIRSLILAMSSSATGSTATSDRDRHAALARGAEAGVHGGVGDQIQIGVGQHEHVVLRAAEGLHALAGLRCRSRRRTSRSGSSRRTRSMRHRGGASSASTDSLSPCTTLSTPSGRPASFMAFAIQMDADGSFSLGFSTTVLPAAIAIGKNHIGTIAGKLNGLMMPTTPSACRSEYTSTPVETCSLYSPLARCGMPQANSTTSRPRAISPPRVGEHLAVLGGQDRGELVLARVQDLAEREQHRGALGPRRVRPVGERGLRDLHRVVDVAGAWRAAPRAARHPARGCRRGRCAWIRPRTSRPRPSGRGSL